MKFIQMNNEYKQYIDKILSSWEKVQSEGALKIITKYGYPQEAIASRLIWYNNGPWKRTIVYRDSVPHNFPTNLLDFIKQTIDYRVPVHLFDEIARLDGSCYPDRTKGEVSAVCHKEDTNFMFLNLVHDIVTGKRTVEEAKYFAVETALNYKHKNISSPYLEGFIFPFQRYTSDPDIQYYEEKM